MNGEEVLVRPYLAQPKLSYADAADLSESEKMDLIAGSSTPFAQALFKLMETEIVRARNEAMECPPEEVAKQRTLMTIAHAMDKFYKNLRSRMEYTTTEHILNVRQKVQEADLQDQAKMEEIILANTRGEI